MIKITGNSSKLKLFNRIWENQLNLMKNSENLKDDLNEKEKLKFSSSIKRTYSNFKLVIFFNFLIFYMITVCSLIFQKFTNER